MVKLIRKMALCGLATVVALGAGCASNQDETPLERRAIELESDNSNLRDQLQDKNSVENALSRELDAKKHEANQLENELGSLRGDVANLRAENDRLRGELAAGAAREAEKPVAVVNPEGFQGMKNVEVLPQDDGSVLLRLSGSVMFETAKDTLTAEGRSMLDRIARAVQGDARTLLSIEGHSDARPLGKTKDVWGSNLALSLARAMSVHDYLKNERKISDKRMRVVGYGEHRPVVSGNDEKAFARNRRVEILLYRD
ncbi:MAG: OmpA family protein [Planctomycetes bacterium]|nr:OmpA family protein [Planctomycetota bacterium]